MAPPTLPEATIPDLGSIIENSTTFPDKTGKTVTVKSIEFKNTESDYETIKIPAPFVDGKVSLRILLYRIFMELFVNQGAYVATSYCLPTSNTIRFESSNNDALRIKKLVVNELQPIWPDLSGRTPEKQ